MEAAEEWEDEGLSAKDIEEVRQVTKASCGRREIGSGASKDFFEGTFSP